MRAARSAIYAGLGVSFSALVVAISTCGVAYLSGRGALGWDEGYIGAFALRLLGGHLLPYVDAISHRGPLLYWMATLAQWLGGPFAWTGLHMLSLLLVLATISACAAFGLVVGRPIAGGMGGLFHAYVLGVALPVQEGLAFNGEQASAPLAVLALLTLTLALQHPDGSRARATRLVATGGLAGLATLTKQTSLVLLAPFALSLLADARARGRPWPKRELAQLLGGAMAPIASVLVVYAVKGELRALGYWALTYNARVYMDPFRDSSRTRLVSEWALREPYLALGLGLVLCVGLGRLFTRTRRLTIDGLAAAYPARSFEGNVALLALVTVVGAIAPLRFYGHYFVSAAPFVGLLVGLGIDRALGSGRTGAHLARGVFAVALLVLVWPTSCARTRELHELSDRGELGDPALGICAAIARLSRPDDTLFVWGFDGDLYVTCARRPASRFVGTTMLAGIVPPLGGRPRPDWIAEGAPLLCARDLEATRPALVLDMPDRIGVSMRAVPELDRFVTREYCPLGQVAAQSGRHATVYARRDGPSCP